MRKIIIILGLFAFAAYAPGDQNDPISQAEALLAKGEYSKGLRILHKIERSASSTALQKANAEKSLAEFYDKAVGDSRQTLLNYRKILRTELASDHPLKVLSRKEILRLSSLETKYHTQRKLLLILRVESSKSIRRRDKTNIKEQIAQLQAVIDRVPDYYRLHEVYYYKGLNHLVLEEFGKAYKSLKKAVQLKPAINLCLPVNNRLDQTKHRWARFVANRYSWGTIGVLLLLTIIVFYTSLPWQWIKLRHAFICLVMVCLWVIVLSLSHYLLAGRSEKNKEVIGDNIAELPAFVSTSVGSPGSQTIKKLFQYGLVGVFWMFVFSIGISKFKYRCLTIPINFIFALLLFCSLITIFYMRHCDDKSIFYSEARGNAYYLKGNLYTVVRSPEPYILTNPKAYPNLNLQNISDPDLKQWVMKYCPCDKGD